MKVTASRLLGILLATAVGGAALFAGGVAFLIGTEAGTSWLLQKSPIWSKGALVLGQHSGSLASGLSVQSVRWTQDRLLVSVATAHVEVSWLDLLDGSLTVDKLVASGVVIHWQSTSSSPSSLPTLPQPPIPISVRTLVASAVQWQTDGNDPIGFDTITLGARWDVGSLVIDSVDVAAGVGSLTGKAAIGGLAPYNLSGQLRVHGVLPELPDLDADLAVSGDLADPVLHAEVQAPYQSSLMVKLSHLGPYSLAGPVSIALRELKPSWPQIRVAGEVEGTGHGTELDYRLRLMLDIDEQPLVPVPLTVSGQISTIGTVFDELEAEQGSERISGSGSIEWRGPIQGQFNLSVEKINPSSWWRNWPIDWPAIVDGTVQAKFTSSGKADGFAIDVTQLDLSGLVRDRPFLFSGAGDLAGKYWKINVLSASYGTSHGTVMARRDKVLDVQAALQIPVIGEWLGKASGSAALGITIQGDLNDPVIKLTVSGKELVWDGNSPAELALAVRGSSSRHQVSLQLADRESRLDARWDGIAKLDGLRPSAYQAEITKLSLHVPWLTDRQRWTLHRSEGASSLAGPVGSVHWEPGQYALKETCLDASDSRLCVAAAWRAGGGSGTLSLRNMPLHVLAGRLPGEYQLEGSGDLVGTLRFDPNATVRWQPDLNLSTSAIQLSSRRIKPEAPNPDGTESADFQSEFETFRLDPIAVTLLAGATGPWQLALRQPGLMDGGLSGEAAIVFVEPEWRSSSIAGEVRVMSSDTAFLEAVLPYASDIQGKASGAVTIGGTLGQPGFQGVVRWADGRFRLPEQGLSWTDVSLSILFPALEDGGSRRIEVVGQGTSNDGTLLLKGDFDWTGDFQTAVGEGRITGNDVGVLNTDLAQIQASPDLQVRIDHGVVVLAGEVLLPRARVRIRERPVSAVTVSEDQRMRGLLAETVLKPVYELRADVGLRFGEDVKFTGFGLDATLGGSITLKQRGRQTSANGSIVTRKGTYTAYGQKLAVNRGRLLWSDTPLLKPAIDIDASRTPTKEVTVGLRASGPIERPEVNLYSVPGMPQSEQLAWLLFGRPLQTTSATETSVMNDAALALGVRAGDFLTKRLGGGLGFDQVGIEVPAGEANETAALVLGKYLTPDLYVSYGISLLQALSTLRIEYALSQDWRVVTESSAERNSADVFFIKERK